MHYNLALRVLDVLLFRCSIVDEKEEPVEDTVKAIESWIEKLKMIERKLRSWIERESQSST